MASVQSIEKSRNQSLKLLEEIQADKDSIEALKIKLESVSEKLGGYKAKEKEVSESKEVIEQSLIKVRKDSATMDELFEAALENNSKISRFYTDTFIPLKDEIEAEKSGAQAFIDNYEEKWNNLKKKQDELTELYNSSESLKSKFEECLNKITEIESSYDEITSRIYDDETGIEIVESHIRGVKSQVDDLYKKIEKNKRETDTTKSSIDTLEANAKTKLIEIGKVNDAASVLKDKIEETYGIATVQAQGGYFDKTNEQLIRYRRMWMIALFTSILLTVSVAILITPDLSKLKLSITGQDIAKLIMRYSLLSPLIYAIIFCGKQFKIARLSVEQYTYKTVVSFSLENEILFLQDKFGTNDSKIIDFALSNLEKLYSEPFHGDQKEFENKITLLKTKNQAKKEQAEAKSKFDLIKHGFIQVATNGESESPKVDAKNEEAI